MRRMAVDAHVHLQDFGPMAAEAISGARAAGVSLFVSCGTSEADWLTLRELAAGASDILPCYGVHPWFVEKRSSRWLEALRAVLCADPSAIGEIGLDRHVDGWNETAQEEAFVAQLQLAKELRLPFMVHCVAAWEWLLRLLSAEGPFPCGFMLHGYGGSAELVPRFLGLGAYFSFAGNTLREKSERRRLALKAVPPERLLIETDAPALLPPRAFCARNFRSPSGDVWNAPENLPLISGGLAEVLGWSAVCLGEQVQANAWALLGPILERRGVKR